MSQRTDAKEFYGEGAKMQVKQACSLLAFLRKETELSGRAIKRALEQGGCLVNGLIEQSF